MDITMPNVNGLEASREIRRILPHAKIVILSQHNFAEMKRQAFAAGADEYVEKSAVSSELVAADPNRWPNTHSSRPAGNWPPPERFA